MIRAAFDIHVIGQRATGNETYAEGLLQAFQAAPAKDVDLVFYHSSSVAHANGRFRRLWPQSPYIRIPLSSPLRLARDGIDVAHFQYFAPPLCPCAVVLTVHDVSFERYPEYFSPAFSRRMRGLMPWMSRNANRLIAVSAATRDDLVDLYGIEPGKIDVIHNGTSAHFRVHPDPERLRATLARLGIMPPFIVCVGNLGRRKNQARVVRAFASLVKRHRIQHQLVLIGKEEHGAGEVRAEIAYGAVRDRVRVAGFVSRDEVVALYNLAEFSVYISHYEGFGLPVLESMACGTPVLASAASCIPEVAGDAALLVDPSDDDAIAAAMGRLLEDGTLRERLRQAGLARCRSFSWAEAASRTLDTYRKALR